MSMLRTILRTLRTLRAGWRWRDAHGIVVWIVLAAACALAVLGLLASGSN